MKVGAPGSEERRSYNRDASERKRATDERIPPCRTCGSKNFTLKEAKHQDGRPRLTRACVPCGTRMRVAWARANPLKVKLAQQRYIERHHEERKRKQREALRRKRAAMQEKPGGQVVEELRSPGCGSSRPASRTSAA